MNAFDIGIGILLLYGLYKGFKNGLFIEVAAIVALIAGLYGAIHFSYIAGDYLAQHFDWNEKYMNLTSFVVTFVLIVIVVSLAGKLLTKIAETILLGTINKIAGAFFGMVKVGVLLGALLVFFHKTNASLTIVSEKTLQASILYTPVKEIGAFVFQKVLEEKEDLEGKLQ